MTFIQFIIAIFILYLLVYSLINRVCRCIEHCVTARAQSSKFGENGASVKVYGVGAGIKYIEVIE